MRNARMLRAGTAAAVLCIAAAGCAGTAQMETGMGMETGASMNGGMMMTDANIAATAATANRAEIEQGQLALQKATHAEVRQYAQMMVTEHTAVEARMNATLRDEGLTPMPNQLTQQVMQSGQQAMAALRAAQGMQFDMLYIDQQIAQHRWLLESLDRTMIPGATNDDLENLLEEVRPRVAAHLEMATRIRANMGHSGMNH